MITRTYLRPYTAIRFAWKNILFSAICAAAAYAFSTIPDLPQVRVPVAVVAILGTALAIILGFRNTSAYERWWEARKIWGGVVNESRTFTRQALTLEDHRKEGTGHGEKCQQLVRTHLAWVNALRLQLRERTDQSLWDTAVARHLQPELYAEVRRYTNKVTQLGIHQGKVLKELTCDGVMDSYSYIQIDDTLSRLTDLQGMAERIKSTPLPRPYDYYTMTFLSLFIIFLPFGMIDLFSEMGLIWLVFPITIIVGWIFFQIYIFGKVMASPFENWHTDVALDAICTTIEIDLRETLGDTDIPKKAVPVNGVLM
jgi:putative membrane protein